MADTRRWARFGGRLWLVLAMVAIVASAGTSHALAPAARAIDECTTSYCATLQVVQMAGTGSGHITSDPAGIDCTEIQGVFSGTCFATFSWPYVVGSIYVDLTISAGSHSYVCMGGCSGIDGTIGTSVGLSPGDHATISPIFSLGRERSVQLQLGGSGAGRVTATPAGLDCHASKGVMTGVCNYDYYFVPGALSYDLLELHLAPDSGSFACTEILCSSLNVVRDAGFGLTSTANVLKAEFWLAVPLTVTVTGHGHVVSTPAAISCPSICSKWLPPAGAPPAPWVLTATPADGWVIKDWTGACDAATGNTCDYYSGFSGGKVGVVFASTATPPPSVAPSTPRPSPAVSGIPHETIPPSLAPGSEPSTGIPGEQSASPNGSIDPGTEASLPPTSPGPVAAAGGGASPSEPGAAPPPAGGLLALDPLLIAVAGLVIVIGLVLGLAIGRRRKDRAT